MKKGTNRICIDYEGDLEVALAHVLRVVKGGRISEATVSGVPIKHFCWATTLGSGYAVYTRRKVRPDAADSFLVRSP